MSGVVLSVCPVCAWRGFPRRLWCPRCGAFELDSKSVRIGVVHDSTTVRRAAGRPSVAEPTSIGTVLLDGDVAVIARLDEVGATDRVCLSTEGGAIVARHATCNDDG